MPGRRHGPVPPREHGGNCDIKNLSRGRRIWLPVYVKGGKLTTGQTVNPSDYIGKRFMAIVEETDSGSTRVGSVIAVGR